jgi:hypothetical protein
MWCESTNFDYCSSASNVLESSIEKSQESLSVLKVQKIWVFFSIHVQSQKSSFIGFLTFIDTLTEREFELFKTFDFERGPKSKKSCHTFTEVGQD